MIDFSGYFIPCESAELQHSETDNPEIIKVVACVVGKWKHWSDEDFEITEHDLENIKKNFEKSKRPVLFDYDHDCLSWGNCKSKAAGWGISMSINEGKLIVDMKPTPAGMAMIKNQEYRYLSPVYVMSSKRKDRVVTLHSVALTNIPFLKELPAIMNSLGDQRSPLQIKNEKEGETNMPEMKDIAKVLSCTEDDVLDRAQTIIKNNAESSKTNEELRLQNAELTKANDELSKKIALQNDVLSGQEIDIAIANGDLKADQRQFALELLKQNRSLYDQFLKNSSSKKAPEEPLKIPNNDKETQEITYSSLLADTAKMLEFAEKYPETYAKMREKYLNGGA